MDSLFWHDRWQNNEIGFHTEEPHHLLQKLFDRLGLRSADKVFVPLCGKSLDLVWLQSQGLHVVGIELSQLALESFIDENQLNGTWSVADGMPCFLGKQFTLFCGDFFQLSGKDLPEVRAVYDRGSLVALPPVMRQRYAVHLTSLVSTGCRILQISYEYDQRETHGPPFSVPYDEILELFGKNFKIQKLIAENNLWSHQALAARGVTQLEEFAVMLTRR